MPEIEARILIVDDEEAIRSLLVECLALRGYETAGAANGREALRRVAERPVDLILTDLRMPAMDGMELLRAIVERGDETAVVLVTACEDLPAAVEAMKAGAYDYLVKPLDLGMVTLAVERALRKRQGVLAAKMAAFDQSLELQRFGDRLQEASQEALEMLVAVLDARERETMCHSKRVSEFAVHLGQVMHLSENEIETLRRAALLHDVGKVGIPDAILGKPCDLTEAERDEMRRHPEIGYRILQAVASLHPAAEIVLAHHANFDGSGYPVTWAGERIPLGARIFSVVDCFDAMTSDRPYRSALSGEEARREIVRCSGTQFDPGVVAAFASVELRVWDEIRARVGADVRSESSPAR
jgi:response regulator RpfG family c-di-GMP phosphodiesterase